ncbi:hypothetical protein [Natrinema sp. SYSU A 869]|uniref:hypothetical protein n=1 Tax=Natrinema sp. SYSU A 869 TaxID=2871694 RepID=UPI001CA43277|nr:hypothetical protein [Natrinema sp. SYSU A 869]
MTDLAEADLVELPAEPGEDDGTVFDSTLTGLLAINEISVFVGEIERDEIGERLATDPDALYSVQFKQTDRIDDYEIYTGTERDNRVAAVGDDAIVYRRGDGAFEAVQSILAARLNGGSSKRTGTRPGSRRPAVAATSCSVAMAGLRRWLSRRSVPNRQRTTWGTSTTISRQPTASSRPLGSMETR